LIHGILIWWGDILLTYALAGALLLLFRKRAQKTLLWWAASIASLPILVISGLFIAALVGRYHPENKPPDMTRIQSVIAIYSHGTVLQILRENVVLWKQELPALGFAAYALFLFLLGMWVWRSGLLDRLAEAKPMLKRVSFWCLGIGIPLNVFTTLANLRPSTGHPTLIGYLAGILQFPSEHILSAGYAAGLAVLIQSTVWRKLLTPFAAVGRMALTDYLTQSVVCTLLYYNYTTGLYGRVGPALDLIPTVLIYGSQVVFSNWWLARFRFGPMEWLWRGLTYGKLPPMRLEPAQVSAPLSAAAGSGKASY
jgi:uncharacterized protein